MTKHSWPFLLVGLTGSIGSGKSTCAQLFSELGAAVINADTLARRVLEPGTEGAKEVHEHFGDGVFLSPATYTIDRKALARRVFGNEKEKAALEAIVHPRVRALFLNELTALSLRPSPPPVVFYDVPLLFESANDLDIFDLTIVVSAPAEQSIQRVMARDRMTMDEVAARLAAQLPIEEKERRADMVIKNTGSFQELRDTVKLVYEDLLKRRR